MLGWRRRIGFLEDRPGDSSDEDLSVTYDKTGQLMTSTTSTGGRPLLTRGMGHNARPLSPLGSPA